MKFLRTALCATFTTAIVIAVGCGAGDRDPFANGGPNGFGNGADGGPRACTNLCRRQKQCPAGGTTSVSGVVMDPAGKVPLYNVLVYVPNAPVAPLRSGATCDRCGSVSGEPLVSALSGVDGRFRLTNVPVGDDIPLVIQIGKWRRQLTIPNVPECTDTLIPPDSARLPRRRSEGDIPQIALTTGGADVMECWLRKIGIADDEFSVGGGPGRVHLYAGVAPPGDNVTTSFQRGGSFGSAADFWRSDANLLRYDLVILSCEGLTHPASKPPVALAAMKKYADAGGRIFASHWHRYWFDTSEKIELENPEPAGPQPSPFERFATWNDHAQPPSPSYASITTTFPKGRAMHDWLGQRQVNALCPGAPDCDPGNNDKLRIVDAKDHLDSVDTPNKATSWITFPQGGRTIHEYISLNTPIPQADDQKCGRVVYSDLHVTTADEHGPPWPNGCKTTDLLPQEKALEFMLFDLSSCIQSDQTLPVAPVN